MKKKISRNKSTMKIGCILMAVSLSVLNPGMSMVYANSDTNTEKKIVSENKTKSDNEKKKAKKEKSDSKQTEKSTEKSTEAGTAQPADSKISQETEIPQKTTVPERAEGDDPDTEEFDTDTSQDSKDTPDVDEESQGPKEEVEEETSDTESEEKTSDSESEEKSADNAGQSEAAKPSESDKSETETGTNTDTAGTDTEEDVLDSEEPSDIPDSDGEYSGEYIEEETEPVPVVGLVEGASTVIVGGLAPVVQTNDQGKDSVNKEAEDDASENQEDQKDSEDQSRIAGSKPLVGGVLAGEGQTATPAPSRTPAPTSSVSRTTATPAATTATVQPDNRVAMNDASNTSNSRTTVVTPAPASNRENIIAGAIRAGVATEDSTKILPFILIGAVALIAIAAVVILKIKRGRKDQDQE